MRSVSGQAVGGEPPRQAAQAGRLVITGQPQLLLDLMAMLDRFSRMFPVVGPRPAAAQGLASLRGLG